VRFHHGLLFSWSLNWLFLNSRSWVLNNRFFNRGWILNGFRVCLGRRFRIGGLLFMSSFKCCFKSFNIFCCKYRINWFKVLGNLFKTTFSYKTIFFSKREV
jgi:hypothetical protein